MHRQIAWGEKKSFIFKTLSIKKSKSVTAAIVNLAFYYIFLVFPLISGIGCKSQKKKKGAKKKSAMHLNSLFLFLA